MGNTSINWEKEKKKILQMREDGDSFDKIALHYGVSRSTVQRLVRDRWRIECKYNYPGQKYPWHRWKRDIIRWKEQGFSYEEIAAKLNIPKATLHYQCVHNWGVHGKSAKSKEWSNEEIDQIISLLEEGKSYVQIAKAMKVSKNRISYIFKHNDRLVKYITRRKEVWNERRVEMRKLYLLGMKPSEIAEQLDVLESDVQFYINKTYKKTSQRWLDSEKQALITLIEGSCFSDKEIHQYWELHWQRAGWRQRTLDAIHFQAQKLGYSLDLIERGFCTNQPELCKILGIQEYLLRRWIARKLLKASGAGNHAKEYRVHIEIKEFVKFALAHPYEWTPFVKPEAYAWVIQMIDDYTNIARNTEIRTMRQLIYKPVEGALPLEDLVA